MEYFEMNLPFMDIFVCSSSSSSIMSSLESTTLDLFISLSILSASESWTISIWKTVAVLDQTLVMWSLGHNCTKTDLYLVLHQKSH